MNKKASFIIKTYTLSGNRLNYRVNTKGDWILIEKTILLTSFCKEKASALGKYMMAPARFGKNYTFWYQRFVIKKEDWNAISEMLGL
jgi:hypothetical protein